MEDTNLIEFSYKSGWEPVGDFILQKLIDLNNDKLCYEDCLIACGYELEPSYCFIMGGGCPYYIKVFMTLHADYPAFFVQMNIAPEIVTENFVCRDGLSLMELLSKLTPIVQLKINCFRPVQELHFIGMPITETPKNNRWNWLKKFLFMN